MAPKTRKSRTTFKLYLIRHGISCANLARNLKVPDAALAADLYTDPELTKEGRKRARALRPRLLQQIQKPFVAGASTLLRTQQTAHLILNPKRLYIIPHIAELGRHSQESTALAPALQEELLKDAGDKRLVRDYTYMEEPVPEDKQLDAFKHWLGTHIRAITNRGRKSLVLVSHYGFIHDLIKELTGLQVNEIVNCELVSLDVTLENGNAVLKNVQAIPYMPKEFRDWDIKVVGKGHGCRLPVKTRRRT